jgi:glutamate 5-kinase
MKNPRQSLKKSRLIVVKLGSGVLSNSNGINPRRIAHVAAQVHSLIKQRRKVILVSSGAIASAMAKLGLRKRPSHIADLQGCAAIGQSMLMSQYDRAFRKYGLIVAQMLLTHEDLHHPTRRANAKHTLHNLLERGVVPIINENDAVAFAEIKFGDNDQLASMVHELIHADLCIILSSIDGFILSGKVVPTIKKINSEIERHAGDSNSHQSVGGMKSKLIAARRVLSTRRPLIIANGNTSKVLNRIVAGENIGTIFLP